MLERAEPPSGGGGATPSGSLHDVHDDFLRHHDVATVVEEGSSGEESDGPSEPETGSGAGAGAGAGAGGPARRSAAASSGLLPVGQWQCNMCTLVNDGALSTCSECGMGINTRVVRTPVRGTRRHGRRRQSAVTPSSLFPTGGLRPGAGTHASPGVTLGSLRSVWSHQWAFEQIRKLLVQQVSRYACRVERRLRCVR